MEHGSSGRVADAYARLVIRLRWVVVAFWLAALAIGTVFLPSLGSSDSNDVASIIPLDSPAIRAELRSIEAFGFPLTSRTVVVQRDAAGLSPFVQAESVLDALAVNQHPQRYPLLGALPVTNTWRLFPGARESNTAVLTFLFMVPESGFADQEQAAHRYIDTHLAEPDDHTIGVAGSVPARAQQADLVSGWLPLLELLTVVAIVVLVGLHYRAVLPPMMALAASAVAFLVTMRITGLGEQLLGLAVPAELEPLLVALLLGVVTDYTIFYVSAFRNEFRLSGDQDAAVRRAISAFTPIVVAAGITVAAGTAALLAAESAFYRAVGPAMAMAIIIGLAVAVTLIPALLAILRRYVLWPAIPRPGARVPAVERADPMPVRLASQLRRSGFVDWLIRPRNAALVLVGSVAALLLCAVPLLHVRLGIGFTQSLPSSNPVRQAADAASAGFAPGITSPTTLLLEAPGITRERRALERLQRAVAARPGLAGVLGPADNFTPLEAGIVLAKDTDAARMVIVFDHDPLGATAIEDLAALRRALPDLVRDSGLAHVDASIAGDTALAEGLIDGTGSDLVRIAIAAIIINLLLLAGFLRALVAPLFLLGSSVLALGASLGLTTFLFQDVMHGDGITFYVPFAAAVLLVSLGSAYNIFAVGHVWEYARRMSLREAVLRAVPESTRAITAAGVTLALSFGMLVVIPLLPFRELAFAMTVGIMLDAVVVRSLITPALLALVGPVSGWPGSRLRHRRLVTTGEVTTTGGGEHAG